MSQRAHALIKFAVLLALIAAAVTAVQIFDLTQHFSQTAIKETVDRFGAWGPVLYITIYALATILFLPGSPLTLAGGALFGPWLGTLWTVIGATIGATLAFLLSAALGRSFVSRLLEDRLERIERYNKKLADHGFTAVLILRLIPIFPFNGLNFGLGLTRVRLRDYVPATALGIIPGAFVYSYLGSSLASLSPIKIAVAALLIVLLLVGTRVLAKLTHTHESNEYDIIVIGAGSGGLNVAGFMNKAGFKVLLVDKSDASIGGDCLNYGCVPSKALLYAAGDVQAARRSRDYGLNVSGGADVGKVMREIKEKQNIIREHENADYFRQQGMDVVLGEAQFNDKRSITVGDEQYTARRIVLATGSRPRELEIPGIENARVYNNETVFDIDHLPERFVFVGGGPISIEMAQAFARLGSRVTVIERHENILGKEDPEIARVVQNQLASEGVHFIFNANSKEVRNGETLVIEDKDGQRDSVTFDALFVGTGRVTNTDNLNLEAAGIKKTDRGKLRVDSYLRTTNKHVTAVGDVAGQHMFTHAAELHASTVISNFFRPPLFKKKLDTDGMAWVTYTDPSVATFGLQEKQLTERGISYRVLENTFENDDRAITDEYRDGRIKLFMDTKERIRGGTIAAPNAGEIAQELILAQHAGLSVNEIFSKITPYPTATRINRSTIANYLGTKLTHTARTLLRVLYH